MELHQAMNRIQRILRDNLFIRRVLSTSGSIEFNRLARYTTSKRIFSRKSDQSGKLYNFHVLIDVSGSMFAEDRYYPAITAAKNIAKLLQHIANVEFTCFNTCQRHFTCEEMITLDAVKHGRIFNRSRAGLKKIDNKCYVVPWDQATHGYKYMKGAVAKDAGERHDTGGGTGDLQAIVNAWSRIKNKEGRNIILVLQDGEYGLPSWVKDYCVCEESVLKYDTFNYEQMIKRIEHDVELVSMGIQTRHPDRTFSNFMYISDPHDIYKNIVTLFERLIDHG